MMAATRPAAGCSVVASTVAMIGPRMNTTSSAAPSSAKAVVSIDRSVTACTQRARTAEPYGGKQAFADRGRSPGAPGRPPTLDRQISRLSPAAEPTPAIGMTSVCP
jgi:hypothetical protein